MNFYHIKENYDILDKYNTNKNISLRTEENVQLDKNDFIKDNLGKKEAKDQNVIGKDNEIIKQWIKEKGIAYYIRKYKKEVRRIEKLNKLYIEIGKETEHDIKK